MASGDQINFKPWFKQHTVPCEGEVGDILVLTPLGEGARDPEPQGSASVWFCIKAGADKGHPAVWARVQFDGVAICKSPVQKPPQARPTLNRPERFAEGKGRRRGQPRGADAPKRRKG